MMCLPDAGQKRAERACFWPVPATTNDVKFHFLQRLTGKTDSFTPRGSQVQSLSHPPSLPPLKRSASGDLPLRLFGVERVDDLRQRRGGPDRGHHLIEKVLFLPWGSSFASDGFIITPVVGIGQN